MELLNNVIQNCVAMIAKLIKKKCYNYKKIVT